MHSNPPQPWFGPFRQLALSLGFGGRPVTFLAFSEVRRPPQWRPCATWRARTDHTAEEVDLGGGI